VKSLKTGTEKGFPPLIAELARRLAVRLGLS
jgi:hypothetical protein